MARESRLVVFPLAPLRCFVLSPQSLHHTQLPLTPEVMSCLGTTLSRAGVPPYRRVRP